MSGPPVDDALMKEASSKKITAGVLAILLGSLGVHKFVLGFTVPGVIMLAVSLVGGFFTCGVVSGVVGLIGLIEGIIYLTKTDQDFYQTYMVGKKEWF